MNLRKPMMATSTAPTPVTSVPKVSVNPGRRATQSPVRNAPRSNQRAKPASRPSNAANPALERRYHQTIRRIDLWSVLKVSVCFYLCALLVFLLAGIILWFAADTLGVIDNAESFLGELFEDKGFRFLPSEILRAATLLGLVFTALATVMTVLATGFYNMFSDLIGGIEITVAEEA